MPAPEVSLSPADRALWSPAAPRRASVPVLVHRGVSPEAFARETALLDHAGSCFSPRLELSFALVFAQDPDAFATRGARNPLGRIEVARDTTEAELHARVTAGASP